MTVRGFSTFMNTLRAERRPVLPVFVANGRFDRSVIMREAVKVARSLRAGGASWQWRMRIGLQVVWGRAKVAMAETAIAPVAAPIAVRPSRIRRERFDAPSYRTRAWNDYAR